jgi:hypothetical protein
VPSVLMMPRSRNPFDFNYDGRQINRDAITVRVVDDLHSLIHCYMADLVEVETDVPACQTTIELMRAVVARLEPNNSVTPNIAKSR